MPLLGIEGIILFSIIALVSLGLAGVRSRAASANGASKVDGERGERGRLSRRPLLRGVLAASRKNSERGRVFRRIARAARGAFGVAPAAIEHLSRAVKDVSVRIGDIGPSREALPPAQASAERSATDVIEIAPAQADLRMDPDRQWTRVTGIIAEGIEKAREVEDLHEAAARQLDAVDYAYERMLVELRDVLPGLAEAQSECRAQREGDYAAVTEIVEPSGAAEGKPDEVDIEAPAARKPVKRQSAKQKKKKKPQSAAA
jgi:hypothetical protein